MGFKFKVRQFALADSCCNGGEHDGEKELVKVVILARLTEEGFNGVKRSYRVATEDGSVAILPEDEVQVFTKPVVTEEEGEAENSEKEVDESSESV